MHRKYGAPGCRVSLNAVYIAEYTHGAKIIPTALQLAWAAAISPSFRPRSNASLTICASTTADLCQARQARQQLEGQNQVGGDKGAVVGADISLGAEHVGRHGAHVAQRRAAERLDP